MDITAFIRFMLKSSIGHSAKSATALVNKVG
jgi:hypothetical protein